MPVDRILERIGYRGPTRPTLAVLRELELAFLLAIPFENLDIHRGRKIELAPESVFDKIVTKRRGGICFERNILFHELLAALGYNVAYLSARMVRGERPSPDFGHMVLLVRLDDEHLVDAGNGSFCRSPLRIDGADRDDSEGYSHRVDRHGTELALYARKAGADWAARFIFTTTPRSVPQFEVMNRLHQTSPDSPFIRHPLVTLASPEGRVTLIGRRLIQSSSRGRKEWELSSDEQYRRCLERYFGIVLFEPKAAAGV